MNLYRPLRPASSEAHLVRVGRIATALIIVGGVLLSQVFHSVIVLLKYIWTLPVLFGASFWLSFLWRRVSRAAAWSAICFSLLCSFLLPVILPRFDSLAENPSLLRGTAPADVEIRVGADREDVAAGLALQEGQLIAKMRQIPPVPLYFEQWKTIDPAEPDSGPRGSGKFRLWVWCLASLGVDFTRASTGTLEATGFLADALLPFLILILVSLFTSPAPKAALDRFFVRVHTPVQRDSALDRKEVELSYADPGRFRSRLLFPGSNWEMQKPDRTDILGFLLAALLAAFIILLVFGVSALRWP
jgi:SSS family solute:Na+ symporter